MVTQIEPEITPPPMRIGEPAWAIATLYPMQGQWSEENYFALESERYVELTNGCIDVLPMPSYVHQVISAWLFEQLLLWCKATHFGKVLYAPLPLKLFPGTIREPDLLIVANPPAQQTLFVLEILNEGAEARKRDFVDKREDYAQAGVPEYWIVDPFAREITVLKLEGQVYVEHGRYQANEIASSAKLTGFSVHCEPMWAEAKKFEAAGP